MSLRAEIENAKAPRYLFFSGKGGVGKTSMSSVTAVWLARRGFNVLHVSTDLQKSLNDIYEQEMGNKPTPIGGVDNLEAVNIETAESMERHRGKIMETLQLLDPGSLLLWEMQERYIKLVYEVHANRAIAEVPLLATETVGVSQLVKLGHALMARRDLNRSHRDCRLRRHAGARGASRALPRPTACWRRASWLDESASGGCLSPDGLR